MNVLKWLSEPNVLLCFGIFCFSAICWFLGSVGIFKISKRLEIKNPWVCFIPLLTPFCIGRIADKRQSKNGKKTTNSAKWILVLFVLQNVLAVLFAVSVFIAKNSIVSNAETAISQNIRMELGMFWAVVPVIILCFSLLAVSVIYAVLYFSALWKAFAIFGFKTATLYLVISILLQNRFCNVLFFFLMNKEFYFKEESHIVTE